MIFNLILSQFMPKSDIDVDLSLHRKWMSDQLIYIVDADVVKILDILLSFIPSLLHVLNNQSRWIWFFNKHHCRKDNSSIMLSTAYHIFLQMACSFFMASATVSSKSSQDLKIVLIFLNWKLVKIVTLSGLYSCTLASL